MILYGELTQIILLDKFVVLTVAFVFVYSLSNRILALPSGFLMYPYSVRFSKNGLFNNSSF